MKIESGNINIAELSHEQAKIIRTGLFGMNWDDFPEAQSMYVALGDAGVGEYDISGEVTKHE